MGLKALETSIQADGWIGAMTAAADGEIFDGSARIETGVGTGFADAVIVESDGKTPIIIVRTDIATADDPKAKRLGLMANRVAELNLSWDAAIIGALVQDAPSENATLQALMERLAEDASQETDAAPAAAPNLDPGEGRHKEQYGVIVLCESEAEQEQIYTALKAEGYTCRVVVT
jgi:hypothetical protein